MWMYEGLSVWLPPPTALLRPWVTEVGRVGWREDADGYVLEGSFFGFRKNEIEIEARDRTLEIRAEKRRAARSARGRVVYRQAVTIPADADPASIDARLDDGELSIRVFKTAPANGRVVPLRVKGALPSARIRAQSSGSSAPLLERMKGAMSRLGARVKGWFS